MAGSTRVVIAEDSKTQAMLLRHILEENGYDVSVGRNGREALEILSESRPAIVITDIMMPVMDGFQLCSAIKLDSRLKTTPVVLLTAYPDSDAILRSLECRADTFVTKPYTPEFLLSQIQYAFDNVSSGENAIPEEEIRVVFEGRDHQIRASGPQIMNLLFSVFQNSVQKTRDLEGANKELKKALDEIRALRGLVPICMHCKKVRDDDGYWQQVETFIAEHSDVEFSHAVCPDCAKALYPEIEMGPE